MCSPVTNNSFDVTPTGLFPGKADVSQDKKCLIISKVIQQTVKFCNMTGATQEALKTIAKKRYEFLSEEKKLDIYQVDHGAFMMHKQGVDLETVKEFYSFRLSTDDIKKWQIQLV